MPLIFLASLDAIAILFLVLSALVSTATLLLARAHLVRVTSILSGQTGALVKKLARLPIAERMGELRRQAQRGSIDWRIADEALQADEAYRAAAVDSVLADVALELEARAMWPRAAMRIAGASGVLLMALAISLHRQVFVAVIVLLMGIFSAIACMTIQRRALVIATEIRRNVDALVDVLELRGPSLRGKAMTAQRIERRSRRR